jgi:uncharacterized membrane protein YozB (DUF420 family)
VPTLRKRADDYFFAAMLLFIVPFVAIGFAHSYFLAGVFRAPLPSPLVHVHGVVFTGWILILIAQIALVAFGRIRWHRRLGVVGMIDAALMVVVGLMTLFRAERRHFAEDAIFTYDLLSLLLFGVLVLWAWIERNNVVAHKRLILLATMAIMAQALSRWTFAFLNSDAVFFSVLDLPLALLVAFDLVSRKRITLPTAVGVTLVAIMQLTYIPLSRSALIQHVIAMTR